MTAHDDASSILVLVEGGQLLLYDLTTSMGQQTPSGSSHLPSQLNEHKSGSPNKYHNTSSQQQQRALQPPPVQQLFKEQLQGQPMVTATRLAMIPTEPLPLRGLQVRCC